MVLGLERGRVVEGDKTADSAAPRKVSCTFVRSTLRPPRGGGVGWGQDLCAKRVLARAHTSATRRQTTRRWALAQRRHVSFEAIGRGTPSSERAGPAVRRICARRAVGTFIGHRQRSRL
eukprot:scaffold38147_cov69-Phaeocystis_antarctica.AAC.1